MSQTEQLTRWRLILGSETQEAFTGMGGGGLSQDELLMDSALGAIYGRALPAAPAEGRGRLPR